MRRLLLLSVLLPAVGCASSGKTDRPPLVVPTPPARVIEPLQEPLPEPVVEIPSSASAPTATAPPPRTNTRPPASREAPPKPAAETKPAEVTGEAAPPTPAPITPPPQLRTAESTEAAEKNIRASVDRARQLLNGVDYRRLNNELRKAYNDSKKFAEQAEDALKKGNVALAQAVATKAETLAKELSARK